MNRLNAREDALVEEWKRCLGHAAENFVPDGVVCGETYESTWPRVVFLLKEVNDSSGGNWELRQFLRSGGRWQTWNNVTRWTEGILALPKIRPWGNLETVDSNARIRALGKIAAVNVKKTPGGATANFDGMRGRIACSYDGNLNCIDRIWSSVTLGQDSRCVGNYGRRQTATA